jgi:intein/homing endonuclease
MKIIALVAENFKRLSAVSIKPDGALCVISGRNEQGKCVPEGTKVALWDGSRKPIEAIRETDLLVGMNPITYEWVPEHPLCMMTSGVQDVFRVSTRTGYSVDCTAKHRLMGVDGWKPLVDFSTDDYIAVPVRLPCAGGASPMSEPEAMLIGLMLGDGSFKSRRISFTASDPGVQAMFLSSVAALWPSLKVRENAKIGGTTVQYDVNKGFKQGRHGGPHLDWAEDIGLRGASSFTKFVPDKVFGSGRDAIISCLAGYFSTDGYVQRDGHAECFSRSVRLATGMRSLLTRIGITTSLTIKSIAPRKGASKLPLYQVTVLTKEGRDAFLESVFPLVSPSRIRPDGTTRPPRQSMSRALQLPPDAAVMLRSLGGIEVNPWIYGGNRISKAHFSKVMSNLLPFERDEFRKYMSNDIGWDQVASISPLGSMQTFDLSMPSEAFIASDFLVHNSSCIDAIVAALGGAKASPEEPIRRGERRARVVLDLGDLTVTRHWTEDGTSLVVEDSEGNPKRSPQALLDRLFSGIALDPIRFAALPPKEQADSLRRLAGLDFTRLDADRQALYEERTLVNRRKVKAEGALAELGPVEDGPTEVVSVSDIARRLDVATAAERANNAKRAALAQARKASDAAQMRLNEIVNTINELLRKKADAEKRVEACRYEVTTALMDVADLSDPGVDAIREELARAEWDNERARGAGKARALAKEIEEATLESRRITEEIASIDAEKDAQLSEAKFPVDGLALNGDTVLYEGVPISQASTARQVRIGLAVAAALRPELRTCLVRDGSALDRESLAEVAAWAERSGMQVIMERVESDAPGGVVIEDGAVKGGAAAGVSHKDEGALF